MRRRWLLLVPLFLLLASATLVILLMLFNPFWFVGFGKGHNAMKHHYHMANRQFNDGQYLSSVVHIIDGIIVGAHSKWVRASVDDDVEIFKETLSRGDFEAANQVCEGIVEQISLYLVDGYRGNFCVNAARFSD